MVVDAADAVDVAIVFLMDTPKIGVEIAATVGFDGGLAVFGGEDDMVEQLRVGVGHLYVRLQGVAATRLMIVAFVIRGLASPEARLQPRLFILWR